MENEFEKSLKEHLNAEYAEISAPSIDHMKAAREMISKRKESQPNADIFWEIAAFLNLKVKLYQVILVFAIGISAYFYVNKKQHSSEEQHASVAYDKMVLSANSNTHLATCKTFKLKLK